MVHRHDPEAEDSGRIERVKFRPFHGIAPVLYQRVFSNRARKDLYGTIAEWEPRECVPVGAVFGVERPKVEAAVLNSVAAVLERVKATYQGVR